MNHIDAPVAIDGLTTPTRPSARGSAPRQRPKTGWLAIAGLLLLSALPVLGGVLRLGEVRAEPAGEMPLVTLIAIVGHIVAMSLFCIVGAFQFSPALQIRRGWHRIAGRVLIPAGIIAALASMWLAIFFGGPPEEYPIAIVRLVFAVPMALFLVMSVRAITRRDFTAHGAWMTRAYAIAVTGGTQAIVILLWSIPFGDVDASGETWLVAVGFVINSVVAEVLIRQRAVRRTRYSRVAARV